jgi:hypothetical protein
MFPRSRPKHGIRQPAAAVKRPFPRFLAKNSKNSPQKTAEYRASTALPNHLHTGHFASTMNDAGPCFFEPLYFQHNDGRQAVSFSVTSILNDMTETKIVQAFGFSISPYGAPLHQQFSF